MSWQVRKRSFEPTNMETRSRRKHGHDHTTVLYNDANSKFASERSSEAASSVNPSVKAIQKELRQERILRRQCEIESDRLKAQIVNLKEQIDDLTKQIEDEKDATKDKIDNMMKQFLEVDIIPKRRQFSYDGYDEETHIEENVYKEIKELKLMNKNLLKKVEEFSAKNENLRHVEPIDLEIKILDQDPELPPQQHGKLMEKIKNLEGNSAKLIQENKRLHFENNNLMNNILTLQNFQKKSKGSESEKKDDRHKLENHFDKLEARENTLRYEKRMIQKQIKKLLQKAATLDQIQSKESCLKQRVSLLKQIGNQKKDVSDILSVLDN